MIENIYKPAEATLGEFLSNRYPNYEVRSGNAPLDMDISHGIELEINGGIIGVYPFILWSDGLYKPCHYWSSEYHLTINIKEA